MINLLHHFVAQQAFSVSIRNSRSETLYPGRPESSEKKQETEQNN